MGQTRRVLTIVRVKLQARHNWKCLALKAVGESIVRQPLNVDVIVNTSLPYIFFFNLAVCSGEYSLFSGSGNQRLWGGLS